MSRIKVSIVSGSRAEFGQLIPLLLRLQEDSYFELDFVVTGAHLCASRGKTIAEIQKYPIQISRCIEVPSIEDNTTRGIGKQIGEIVGLFSEYYSCNRPDILLVTGDRYEMFAVGIAAYTLKIPMAHLCGGSTTVGAIDEGYRHSLTKMSQFHFVTCEIYRKRVIQLGEQPQNVYNVGSLAIENCYNIETLSEFEIRQDIGLSPSEKYCIVTYHPVTLESENGVFEVRKLIEALDSFPNYSYVITLSNMDAGGTEINDLWRLAEKTHEKYHVVPSLGMKRYLSALKYAEMMIGNSSSGTTEGPTMHIPTVDIGNRQKGRFFADSVIHCDVDKEEIIRAISRAADPVFKRRIKQMKNPFGDGTTSQKIVELLKEIASKSINVEKEFYDLDVGGNI